MSAFERKADILFVGPASNSIPVRAYGKLGIKTVASQAERTMKKAIFSVRQQNSQLFAYHAGLELHGAPLSSAHGNLKRQMEIPSRRPSISRSMLNGTYSLGSRKVPTPHLPHGLHGSDTLISQNFATQNSHGDRFRLSQSNRAISSHMRSNRRENNALVPRY